MAEPESAVTAPLAATASADVEIRALTRHDELLACVELQRATWGADFSDLVPASILKVSQRVGGVTAGAFGADGRLLGFVFGLTGVENGQIVHWSDMLAVREEARDLGLGRRLKEFQRDAVRAVGGTVIYWTYDPLVARNAHLNFNKLGVRAADYVEDMYGETDSDLHRGLGTDRFIVAWPVSRQESEALAARSRALGSDVAGPGVAGPLVNSDLADGSAPDLVAIERRSPSAVRIAVPRDIHALQSRSLELAGRWRTSTRRAFQWALSRGYAVRGVYAEPGGKLSHYVLTKP